MTGVPIKHIAKGMKVRVQALNLPFGALRERFLAMGLIPGTVFLVERQLPFGGPCVIKLHQTRLLIRPEEIANLVLEQVIE